MNDEAFGIADIGQMRKQFHRIDELLARFQTAFDTETDEATPLWTDVDAIPYHRMWADDHHWLPLLLDQQTFLGRFIFAEEVMLWSEIRHGMADWGGTGPSPA